MQIQWLAPDNLTPYANNPRDHAAAVDKVAMSLEAFGFKQPIVVDAQHVIVVGHTRWLAAKQLKLSKVPVLVADDLTCAQAKAYRLADNRTHEEATWERDKLAQEIAQMVESGLDIALTGFDARELAALSSMAQQIAQGETALHDCPDPSIDPVSQSGDLWCLGRHRLLCGDSTDVSQMRDLMGDARADMVFTDPPYNVNYSGRTADQLTLLNDALNKEAFTTLLHQAFAACFEAIKPTASLYICYADTHRVMFEESLLANHFAIRSHIIWAKQQFVAGHSRYQFQHEPIFYAHIAKETDPWYGDKRQSTLWLINKPHANRLHPTMKPIALIEKALHNSSREGDIVLDLFGGSGSTLIACEKNARIGYLMELDPCYADAIILRWQAFTGQKAVLVATSASFEEAKRSRLAENRKTAKPKNLKSKI